MNPITMLVVAVSAMLTAATPDYSSEMDRLQKQALDEAFQRRMMHLFDVWMAEPHPDPARPIAGAQKYRDAYTAVRKEIDKRQQ